MVKCMFLFMLLNVVAILFGFFTGRCEDEYIIYISGEEGTGAAIVKCLALKLVHVGDSQQAR